MGFLDDSKKIFKQIRIKTSKLKGNIEEKSFPIMRGAEGYSIKRTGIGSDFEEQKIDWITGKKGKKVLVEVKSSQTAPLSPLQKETQKKAGKDRYRVHRGNL